MSLTKRSPRKKFNKVIPTKMQAEPPPDAWYVAKNQLIDISQTQDKDDFLQHFKPLFTIKHDQPKPTTISPIHRKQNPINTIGKSQLSHTPSHKVKTENKILEHRQDSHSMRIIKGNSVFVCRLKSLDCKMDYHLPFVNQRKNRPHNYDSERSPHRQSSLTQNKFGIFQRNIYTSRKPQREPVFFRSIVPNLNQTSREARMHSSSDRSPKLKTTR